SGFLRPRLRCSAPLTARLPKVLTPSVPGLRERRRRRDSQSGGSCFCGRMPPEPGPRKARRRRGGLSPQGTAQDARSFAAVQGRTVSEPPQRLRAPGAHGCAEGAPSGVCFFGYLLCTSKEGDPLGRRPSGSLAPKQAKQEAERQIKMDSRLT